MKFELSWNTFGAEEIAALHRTIDSGRFTMGPQVAAFEAAFAERFDVCHALMTSSGSAANLLAVAALCYRQERPLQRGDEVIVPAIGWATTYAPLQQYGLRLRFVDVELETLNLDVTQLEQALTPRTRMLVAVSILGNPAALDQMRVFCDRHDLIFLEDNCESLGAELNGRYAGTFGDLGTFSFFFSHHISTMEGGMLVTDDPELYQRACSLRAHGWTRNLPQPNQICEKRDDDFFEAYRFILPGYNLRPLEFSGAVGLEQLRKLDGFLAVRRRNAAHFVELFGGRRDVIIQREHGRSSWFSFTLILPPELGDIRSQVLDALRQADIEFRIITGGCFPCHEVIRYFDYDTLDDLSNARLAHERGFFIGNYPVDLRAQLDRLAGVLDQALSAS
ncbi:MAG: DegT/DnrJ/EryC1/StrS family aminotransferase [Candidatus Competibacteraceae bacterium]|nr:DegT/DnrJ/EryC1/StrS family aminotransferase [Candidatus Competibacteraceae bacterium]